MPLWLRSSKILAVVVCASWIAFGVQAATHYQRLQSFGFVALSGSSPQGPLMLGTDGALYGTTYGGGTGRGTVFKLNIDGSGYILLHQFGSVTNDGYLSSAGLIEASDGALYGTTESGAASAGIVFKVNKDGSDYRILHGFGGNGSDGGNPRVGVIEGTDGVLYGTTPVGGTNSGGTVFKLNKDGSGYRTLYDFGVTVSDGWQPYGGLIEGTNGTLYGITSYGGSSGGHFSGGTVFKLNRDGTGYVRLHNFGSVASDGQVPLAAVTFGSDGVLYGTTFIGGSAGSGTVYKLNQDGTGYSVLRSLASTGGQNPVSSLIEGSDTLLYGTTQEGGSAAVGTLFKLNRNGTGFAVLHSFSTNGIDGQSPRAALVEGNAGALYLTTAGGGASQKGTVVRLNRDGSDYAILRSFSDFGGDGLQPSATLVEGTDGALYGTTVAGGTGACSGIPYGGCGTVFKLKKDGTSYSILHNFNAGNGDGGTPLDGVIRSGDGFLYGTTSAGGSFNAGTVFRLSHEGSNYFILHHFNTTGLDGQSPRASLLEGRDGLLYGTTFLGGASNAGTVFKLNKDGSGHTVLRSFLSTAADGAQPQAGLIQASDGALYGTTSGGGINFNGTIFKLNTNGSGYGVLHFFASASDGYYPVAPLVEASDGMLYGTTLSDHDIYNYNWGTIFRLNKDGTGYQVLSWLSDYSWVGAVAPAAGLVEGDDGALYGTTWRAAGFSGAAFRVTKSGAVSLLHYFGGVPGDGTSPYAGLLKASDGLFYGATREGGGNGYGTIFRLWPPQTPDMVGINLTGNAIRTTFAGSNGYHYAVLRSPDLSNWITLATITMPASGFYTNLDATPLPQGAFYRAAWVP